MEPLPIRTENDPRPAEWASDPSTVAAELAAALELGQLVLHFQPIFDLRTGEPRGAEALVRWEHPDHGLIAPGRFIPEAESSGSMPAIEDWILSAACQQARAWGVQRRAQRLRPLVVSINLSAQQVSQPGLSSRLLERFLREGVDPNLIGIEVTEAVLAGDDGTIEAELRHLRSVGARVSLENFGTGTGYLARFGSLPIDVVQIEKVHLDRSNSKVGEATIGAIIALAHAIDARVLAEGVESPEQLELLRSLGCDLVSGFLLARPTPSRELEASIGEGAEILRSTAPAPPRSKKASSGAPRAWRRRRRTPQDANEALGQSLAVSDRDPLTGLGTHRFALATLGSHLLAGRRPALLLVDLDGFRAFNLMRGREAADELLRAQARRLNALEGTLGFRISEDLFALIIPDAQRGPLSHQIDLVELAQGPKGTTACVGIARTTASDTPEHLEQCAREALSAAKRRGHGSVVDSSASSEPDAAVTPGQARALQVVLREGFLRVHYQPIQSLADDTVIGYEALARPQLDHALAGPAEAFTVADRLGLVPELDAVCRDSVFHDGPGYDMAPNTRLFINVAPQALGHRSLRSGELRRKVTEAGLEPGRVVFELSLGPESDPEVFAEEAGWLVERGYAIAFCDAGGTFAGLEALRRAPFSIIKLAAGLLRSAREQEAADATLQALLAYAERAGIDVIATGIESRSDLANARVVRSSGGDRPLLHAVQGYHLGKPQPQPRSGAMSPTGGGVSGGGLSAGGVSAGGVPAEVPS